MRSKPSFKVLPEEATPLLKPPLFLINHVQREREEEEDSMHFRYELVEGAAGEEEQADHHACCWPVQPEDRK